MTDKLPQNLRALFAPRPPLRYLPAHDVAPEERRTARITGIAQFLPALQEKKINAEASETHELEPGEPGYERPSTESILEKNDRERREKQDYRKWLLAEGAETVFKPRQDKHSKGYDEYKTLFVARLSFDVDKHDLTREFERFGTIERVRIVTDTGGTEERMMAKGVDPKRISKTKKRGAPKGYAFIVYKNEGDMKAAYKEMDGASIKGRRILVDVERGRTVNGWKPMRLGGGIHGRHHIKAPPPRPGGGFGFGGPPPGPGNFRGGGFRGRGDFRGDGGFRGGRGGGLRGGRGGVGYSNGMPPDGAPAGPRGGFGDRGYGGGGRGGYGGGGGGGGYEDRGPRNANYEPLPPRGGGGGGGGGFRDRDGGGDGFRGGNDRGGSGGYGGGEDRGRKRPYDGGGYGGGGYEERNSRPRY